MGKVSVGECLVCPSLITDGSKLEIEKKMTIRGLPDLSFCSKTCRLVLNGKRAARGKGLRTKNRIGDWVTAQLGPALRTGDIVELLRDTSANRDVSNAMGRISEVQFDQESLTTTL